MAVSMSASLTNDGRNRTYTEDFVHNCIQKTMACCKS